MIGLSDLRQDANVVLEHDSHVSDPMAHLSAPVDPETERESRPFLRVDTDRLEDCGIDHPATSELYPAGPRAGSATFSSADGACDLEFG